MSGHKDLVDINLWEFFMILVEHAQKDLVVAQAFVVDDLIAVIILWIN